MKWSDNNFLTPDINEARLRAKFYGALYIIHRPFLHYALHSDEFQEPETSGTNIFSPTQSDMERRDMPPPTLESNEKSERDWQEVFESARTCIKAAARSTLAFDGIINKGHESQRLIVTNIFGTAHA